MALDKASLKSRIITELQAQGFTTTGTYAWTDKFAEAVANAVVDEIQANARAQGQDTPTADNHDLAIV